MANVPFFLVFVIISKALAAEDELFVNNDDSDTAVVESTVREVRAVPTNIKDLVEAGAKLAYLHTYDDGKDGDNEKGYYKKTEDKGDDGYKHFDSYHKKDGDKYGYEKHTAFGKYAGHDYDTEDEKEKYTEDKESYKEGDEAEESDGEESKHTYQIVESADEDDGDNNQYTAGDEGGHSEQYTEGGDSDSYEDGGAANAEGESEHYEEGDSAGYDGGNYGSEGSLGHEGGSSPYSYFDGGDAESEHYSAADDEGDY